MSIAGPNRSRFGFLFTHRQAKTLLICISFTIANIKGEQFMSKSEITVTCFFTEEGETACQIFFRSFYFFLQRELMRDGRKLACPAASHV